jgi:enoyl-CoA hydratase/carnithine racemase
MSKILSKADILGCSDLRFETVAVPEWGGSVRVRTLSGAERDAFEATLMKILNGKRVPDMDNLRAKLLAATVVDEEDKPIFGVHDLVALGRKSAVAIDRIFAVAQRLNAMAPESVEESIKNSMPGPSAGSISD